MATTKPRLTITLEPSHYDVVTDVARLRGVSRSAVVTEMLGASIPALERVSKLLEALEAAKNGGYVEDFAEKVYEAERTLAPLLASVLEQMDLPIQGAPPSSNTGVTSLVEGSHKPRGKSSQPSNRAASKASGRKSRRASTDGGSES